MTPRIMRRDGRRGYEPMRRMTFRTIILWTLALALILVVVTNLQASGVDAATELQRDYQPPQMPVDGGDELEPDLFCEPPGISGDHTMADVWSAEMEHAMGPDSSTPSFASESEMATIWSADMTVGRAADSHNPILVYTGYFPVGSEYQGNLNNTAFSVDGLDYKVNAIFQQEFGGNVHQLVFKAGNALPDDLILQVGDDQFQVSESSKLGSQRNIHSWMLEQSLGWEEGATMPVALMELPEPVPGPGPICNTVSLQ